MALKETLKQKIEEFRPRTTRLTKEFGKVVIDQVTIDQAIGGARDIRSASESCGLKISDSRVLLVPPPYR